MENHLEKLLNNRPDFRRRILDRAFFIFFIYFGQFFTNKVKVSVQSSEGVVIFVFLLLKQNP